MLCLSACGSSDDITEDNCKHIEEIIPGRTATYTETGLTDGKKCSICGKVLVKQSTIPLLKASEGLSFSLNEDKSSYSVSGLGNCTDTELIIPHKYNNLPVTSIHSRAFYGCTQFTIITIPDSITYINYGTFSGCSSLTSITIPNSLTSIGEDAFSGCSSLSSITIPDSVTSIGEDAFEGCSNLTKANITSLEAWCNIKFSNNDANPLYYAKNLYLNGALVTDLVIPNTVTEIKDSAFIGCSSLTSVTIPDSVTSIGYSAFVGCSNLTSIAIPDSVTSIGNVAFFGCSSLTSITIPDSVTSIGNLAFYDCSSLTSVTFSNANGWYVTKDSSATHGISMDVKNTSTNATNLKNTLNGYYWKRNS
ncbi:MAG: leucine-rich repeat domain-containing protein [Clostridia bacterium]|nr:leucine-rich repeat domain-containing protein [Clostridia bacterium]